MGEPPRIHAVFELQDFSKTKGKFITVEGQDGAGKTTNLDLVESRLTERGIAVTRTREPGGTALGESLRELLLGTDGQSIFDLPELLLIFAARAQHLEEVIAPALTRGNWVLCDRFTDATYAYQGGGRSISKEVIAHLETIVQGSLRPDLTILLDLDVATGAKRTISRGYPDRFELEEENFKDRVRKAYCAIAMAEPERVKLVDAGQQLPDVQASIEMILKEFLEITL
jgi:dTMP kinase